MKQFFLFFSLIICVGILSCSNGNDDEEVVPVDAHYYLTLVNNTEENIEIFLQGLAGEDFDRRGLLVPEEEMVIQLMVDHTYVVRATNAGEALENYFFQETITRLSPTDFVLEINE